MNTKKRVLTCILGVIALLSSAVASAGPEYKLNGALSSVNFATIKKQYVVEPATLTQLVGGLSLNGDFSFYAPLTAIDTGVGIRNDRVANLYFKASQFANVKVDGKLDMSLLKDNPALVKTIVNATVSLFGQSKSIDFPVTVVKSGSVVTVNSSKPVIISGEMFNIPASNLSELAATVGDIPLSSKVPVTINLVLQK